MPSTATTRNRLEKQGTGDNINSWGAKLNTTGLDLIDAALDGTAAYALSGTKTLTSTNYAADEARMRFQNVTGGTGGTITIPSVEKTYFFRNASSGSVVVTTGSGATATLTAGTVAYVATDGTNVYAARTLDYGASLLSSSGTPSASAHLTNKAYVDSAILNASLSAEIPDQTGNSGKYLTTDGTNASWGAIDLSLYAPLASPILTGTPAAPTAAIDTNSTQLATTAFVLAQASAVVPAAGNLAGTVGTSTRFARADHAHPPAPWTQVGQIATTSGTTATFSNIPQTYADLLFVFNGVSPAGSGNLAIELSPDGSTWTTAVGVSTGTLASSTIYGSAFVPRYVDSGGQIAGATSSITTGTTAAIAYAPVIAWRVAGITHVRFSITSGVSFDAGNITLYAR